MRFVILKIILIILSIVVPIGMYYSHRANLRFGRFYNFTAIISAIIFGDIAAVSVYQIIIDKTVFMTKIHAIFLNPFFLITGAYLGVYAVYMLILLTMNDGKIKF